MPVCPRDGLVSLPLTYCSHGRPRALQCSRSGDPTRSACSPGVRQDASLPLTWSLAYCLKSLARRFCSARLHAVSAHSHAHHCLLAAPHRLRSPDFSSNGANGKNAGTSNRQRAISNPRFVFSGSVSTTGRFTARHPLSFSTTTAASSRHHSHEGYASSLPSLTPMAPVAPNKTTKGATTTALRTPTPAATPVLQTTKFTTTRWRTLLRSTRL